MFEVPHSDIVAVEVDKDAVQGKSQPRYVRLDLGPPQFTLHVCISNLSRNCHFEFQSSGQGIFRGGIRLWHRGGELAPAGGRRQQLNHIARFT